MWMLQQLLGNMWRKVCVAVPSQFLNEFRLHCCDYVAQVNDERPLDDPFFFTDEDSHKIVL